MWLALEIVVPVLIGVGGFHALMRLRLPRDEARRATMRFAALWVPAAVVIVIAATVVYGN